MEAFLRNLPPNLTDQSLRKELDSFMKALDIVDWSCDKPRRKGHAWITFLKIPDGQKFLKNHGKTTNIIPPDMEVPGKKALPTGSEKRANTTAATQPLEPKTNEQSARQPKPHVKEVSRLRITNTNIYVEKSTRTPNKFALSHLKHEQHERARAPERSNRVTSDVKFNICAIACGHNVFAGQDNSLTFVQQCISRKACTVRITQQSLSIICSMDFRIDIPCDTIQDFIAGHNDETFTLVLTEPPRFYTMINQGVDTITKWERMGSSPYSSDHSQYIDRCLVYQLSYLGSTFATTVRDIKMRDLISVTQDTLLVSKTPKVAVHDYTTSMAGFEGKIRGNSRLPFPLLFQLQALVWGNYLHPFAGTRMLFLMDAIAKTSNENGNTIPFSVESMKKLYQQIPYPCPGTEPSELNPETLVERIEATERLLQSDGPSQFPVYGIYIPDNQAWVMKAMITPTRIFLHGPEAESKNRILRMFPNHNDYFLRCLFCDEDGQDLSFNPKVSHERVFLRYRRVLEDGIQIAGRKFSFLGFSHSSLRSHSAWFMAPFTDDNYQKQSYETIIGSLGRFSDIRVPAKCAARIGQAFSETPYAIPIVDLGILNRSIPDVKSKDGTRVFSDGVGTLSYGAMQEFWGHLPENASAATCFQIRWGGAKGMLSLDTRLRGKVICIRQESMQKFPSEDLTEMGICDTASRPFRLMLNRQMIKILEDMGTKDDWFLKLQTEELRILRAVTAKAPNTSTFLRYQLIGTNMGLPQFIRQIDQMGIDYRRDPFLRTVVEHVVLRELRLLKHKARIPVPQGVTLFGIMDETGFLEEGEIFVTFEKSSQVVSPPKHGRALVTRSPALHPGDIRVANIVAPPPNSPLRHLQNCIVFSQHGKRDLPSQLSGGDLDGDLYNVIWDPEAMPKRVFEPADYPRVDPQPLPREVTREDIADFFINFMKTDVLGMIATRHLIMSDVAGTGTQDPDCIALAGLHSTAVDSSKTGIPVEIRDLPKAPRTRPDFLSPAPPLKLYDLGQIAHIGEDEIPDEEDDMVGVRHRYHQSEKILGKLYRSIDENKIWAEDITSGVNQPGPTVWDQLVPLVERQIVYMGYDVVYQRQLDEAWRIRNLYESSVLDMMSQFSDNPRTPISEVEVFCGSILNKRGSQTRRQRDSSMKLRDEIDRVTSWIVNMIRPTGEKRSRRDTAELCLACLHVGCAKNPAADETLRGGHLKSFRVLAACCLIRELNSLARDVDSDLVGGGFVGVGSAQQRQMTLPLR